MSIERLHKGPRMSQCVIHNKTVYVAGQVAAGVLSATIWLTDMSTFSQMNRVWDGWVVPGATPARATVLSAQLAAPEFKIEIAVIAAQP